MSKIRGLDKDDLHRGGTGSFFTGDEVRRLNLCCKARGITRTLNNQWFDLLRRGRAEVWKDESWTRTIRGAGELFRIEQERYYQPGRKFASTMMSRKAA